jgi:mannose-6-phosphate isomerase-like protein (cupin superfamily)
VIVAPSNEVREVLFCGCKQTQTPPFCDGSHNNLPGGYSLDDRTAEELAGLRKVKADEEGIRRLDGDCYAIAAAAGRTEEDRGYSCRPIIGPALGAVHQSQFYLEMAAGSSPIFGAGDSDVILWIGEGHGEVEISGRSFPVQPRDGIFVKAGEGFRLRAEGERLTAFVSVCPAVDRLSELEAMPDNFEAAFPERVVSVDESARSEMGPRYFQMLIDKEVGSTTAAQFIGYIPQGRAKMHKHLYEEALIIASGRGVLWNETSMTEVQAGDVIFLPRKHSHSLECLARDAMLVVGVIHPGDNPAINY